MTYTDEQIDGMLAGITPGEWVWEEGDFSDGRLMCGAEAIIESTADGGGPSMVDVAQPDAAFIAAAPAIVRQLLRERDEALTVLEGMDVVLDPTSRMAEQLAAAQEERDEARAEVERLRIKHDEMRTCLEERDIRLAERARVYDENATLRAQLAAAQESKEDWQRMANGRSARIIEVEAQLATYRKALEAARGVVVEHSRCDTAYFGPAICMHCRRNYRRPHAEDCELAQALSAIDAALRGEAGA